MDEVTFVKTKYRMEQWVRLINDRQNIMIPEIKTDKTAKIS